MDVKVFGYFESVCRNGSVARAARELGISAQGLSAALQRLSQSLNAPLLVLQDGALAPTDYGEAVLAHARDINSSYLAMHREVASLLAHDENVIKLGAVVGAIGYLGEDVFEPFNQSGPGAQVLVVREAANSKVLNALLDGSCDMAILAADPGRDVRSIELVRDCFFLWVKRGDPLAKLPCVSLKDLKGRTLAIFDQEPALSDSYAEAARMACADVEVLFVGEVMRVFDLVFAGRAVGLTCRNHVEATRGSGVVGVPFSDFEMAFWLCYRMRRDLTGAEAAFLDFMGERRVRWGRPAR